MKALLFLMTVLLSIPSKGAGDEGTALPRREVAGTKPTGEAIHVIVFGQVAGRLGRYQTPRQSTLLDAILDAGGFSNLASGKIVLKRKGQEMRYEVNFDRTNQKMAFRAAASAKAPPTNPPLEDGDVIVVGEVMSLGPCDWHAWSREEAKKRALLHTPNQAPLPPGKSAPEPTITSPH